MMYHIIEVKNLCFSPSTRKRQSAVFKNLHSGHLFLKPAFLVPETSFSGVDGRLKRRKKFRFYPNTYGRGLILAFEELAISWSS